ncbi:hypothetical protein D9757_011109 [Collybiopsis confluens]|uniref:WD40 repeat-like protein n=1 Tax=Collybiopsis confluens TaxID=2823264 RepID=A0A8H5GXB5_9AGAR|nr:hypothetical protein D9757_011109 [Collybiopsis confluens]
MSQHNFQLDGNPVSWLPGYPKYWGGELTRIDFKGASTSHHLSLSDDGHLLSVTVGPDIYVYTVDYPADSQSESNLKFDIRLKRIFQSKHGEDVEFAEFGPIVDGAAKVLVSSGGMDDRQKRRRVETVNVWSLDPEGGDDTNIPLAIEAARGAVYEVLLQNDTTHNAQWLQKAQNIVDGFEKVLRIAQPRIDAEKDTVLEGSVKRRTFSRDGSSLLVFPPHHRPERYVSVVATDSLREQFRLEGHRDTIIWAEFSPDNEVIATSSWDSTVRIWNATSGEPIHVLTGATGQSWNGAFSPDSKWVAAGDDKARIWNVQTGELVHTLEGSRSWIRSLAFSPDSQALAGGSGEASLRIFGVQNGEPLWQWQQDKEDNMNWVGRSEVTDVLYTSRGSVVFGTDGQVHLLDTETGKMGLFERKESKVGWNSGGNFVVSPDGGYLFTADFDGSVRVWKI